MENNNDNFNPEGYQQNAYQQENYNPVGHPPTMQPEPDTSRFSHGFSTGEYSVQEPFPTQTVSLFDAFGPRLNKWVGVGISKFLFWIGYLLILITSILFYISWLISAFHTSIALGVVSIFIMAGLLFLNAVFSILFLRLTVEIILSIFSIRDKISGMNQRH
eukprot:gb/GECH01011398.1/.p1 GENE.gb/GECH01011398.1/~~gb/GECH01011398.1/.p1  ORF type:complete len:161 (+),score=27.47 gb/GECH01011398.1/:1-483(+)